MILIFVTMRRGQGTAGPIESVAMERLRLLKDELVEEIENINQLLTPKVDSPVFSAEMNKTREGSKIINIKPEFHTCFKGVMFLMGLPTKFMLVIKDQMFGYII
jgi:hypothetical protein